MVFLRPRKEKDLWRQARGLKASGVEREASLVSLREDIRIIMDISVQVAVLNFQEQSKEVGET